MSGKRRDKGQCGGFTLLELMVVVAIVGLLAAFAIPSFSSFHMRSKATEAKVNLRAIRNAQLAYLGENGAFASASASPASWGGAMAVDFVDTGPPSASFATIGWNPEGRVYFSYAIVTDPSGRRFTADAAADMDEDGTPQVWGLVQPDVSGATELGFHGCPGVWNPATSTATSTSMVGPCGSDMGRGTF